MTTTARSSSSAVPLSVPLTYTIASSTPHSGKYVPENIMVDKPQDQSSRWSGAFQGNATDQWIILRLESLSVLGEFGVELMLYFELLRLINLFHTLVREDNIRKGERDRMIEDFHHLDTHVDSSSKVRAVAVTRSKPWFDARLQLILVM